jgi:hypothetical protein
VIAIGFPKRFQFLPIHKLYESAVFATQPRLVIRRAWTKDDVRQMKTMAKSKAGVTKIAKALKRSSGATSVMAAKLGVSLAMR